jgi:hypothetical protein
MKTATLKTVKCKTCNGMGMTYAPVTFLLTNCPNEACKCGWVKVAR